MIKAIIVLGIGIFLVCTQETKWKTTFAFSAFFTLRFSGLRPKHWDKKDHTAVAGPVNYTNAS